MADDIEAQFAAYAASQTGTPVPEPAPAPELDEDQPETVSASQEPEQESEQPSQPAADDDDDDDGLDPARPIPFSVLKKTRRQKQEAERKLTEIQRERDLLSERMSTLQTLWQNARKAEVEAPAAHPQGQQSAPQPGMSPAELAMPPEPPEDDIFAHAKWTAELAKRQDARLKQLEAQIGQTTQQIQQQEQLRRVVATFNEAEREFAQRQPDYQQAVEWARMTRMRQLSMFMSEDQAAARVNQEALGLVTTAMQRGVHPAEFAYKYALSTGYQPPAAEAPKPAAAAAPKATPPRDANGQFKPAASEQIATATRAAAANKSLSGAPGGAGSSMPTAETFARMSQDEFNAAYAKNKKAIDKILSGG